MPITDLDAAYDPDERLEKAPEEAEQASRIEISFEIPVFITSEQHHRLRELVCEITKQTWNTPLEGVHWVSSEGAKPIWSQADAAFLGETPDPNAPESGEPEYDHSVLTIGTSARGWASNKERKREKFRRDALAKLGW